LGRQSPSGWNEAFDLLIFIKLRGAVAPASPLAMTMMFESLVPLTSMCLKFACMTKGISPFGRFRSVAIFAYGSTRNAPETVKLICVANSHDSNFVSTMRVVHEKGSFLHSPLSRRSTSEQVKDLEGRAICSCLELTTYTVKWNRWLCEKPNLPPMD
jgi:hypothetical protein